MTAQTFDQRISDIEKMLQTDSGDSDGTLPLISTLFHSRRITDPQKRRLNAICTDYIFNSLNKTIEKLGDADYCPSSWLACNIMGIIFVEENISFLPPKTREELEEVTLTFYAAVSQRKANFRNMRDGGSGDQLKKTFKALQGFLTAPEPETSVKSTNTDYDPSKIQVNGGRRIIFNDAANDQNVMPAKDAPDSVRNNNQGPSP